jgi:hypothetical protein
MGAAEKATGGPGSRPRFRLGFGSLSNLLVGVVVVAAATVVDSGSGPAHRSWSVALAALAAYFLFGRFVRKAGAQGVPRTRAILAALATFLVTIGAALTALKLWKGG